MTSLPRLTICFSWFYLGSDAATFDRLWVCFYFEQVRDARNVRNLFDFGLNGRSFVFFWPVTSLQTLKFL
jgi:hypothetical protein